MGYGLGVDLGTTHTAAAILVDGRVEVVKLGRQRPEIPSLVFVLSEDGVLVGEAAERRGAVEPERLAREFKRRFGDPVPLLVGGAPYPAHVLTARVLRWVLDMVTRQYDAPPDRVTVTHPANWGPFKRELLEQSARLADADGVTFRTEPEAAAINFATGERVRPGEAVAVYDLGGGTFDAAVLRKTEAGFTLLGKPEGIEQLGGVDFDEAVFAHVVGALGAAADALDPDDEAVTAALAQLRKECVEAKEALTFDTEVMIPVALPGLHTRIRLNRSEFEAMIGPVLAETIAATGRALRSAGVAAGDLRSIVLAGGSSRIPLVTQLLQAEFGRPVALDPQPELGVARGAAATARKGPFISLSDDKGTLPNIPARAPAPSSSSSPSTSASPSGAPAAAPAAGTAAPAPPAAEPAPVRFAAASAAVRPAAATPAEARGPLLPPAVTAWAGRAGARLRGRTRWLITGVAALALVASAAALAWPEETAAPPPGDPAVSQNPTLVAAAAPSVLWSRDTGGPITGRPALDPNTVFGGSRDGGVYAWERTGGGQRWRYATGGPVSAPRVRNGVVYAASEDGTLYAIGAGDGALRWRAAARTGGPANPVVSTDTVYVGGDGGTLHAYTFAGKVRWRFDSSSAFATMPAVAGGMVYATSEDGRLHAFDAGSGRRRWMVPVGGSPSGPAVAGGLVLVGAADGRVTAWDAASGDKRWEFRADGRVEGAPLLAGDLVYFGTSKGLVYALGAADQRPRWWFTVDDRGPVPASVGLVDGIVYAGSQANRIYALDAVSGRQLWEFPAAGPIGGSPRVENGVLYVGGDDGTMYALRLPAGVVGTAPSQSATPSVSPSPSPSRTQVAPRTTKPRTRAPRTTPPTTEPSTPPPASTTPPASPGPAAQSSPIP
ncbi:PQQ-binding-like beta-propeller repeat protein [Actinomycetes bacterium KLBMP 9797]